MKCLRSTRGGDPWAGLGEGGGGWVGLGEGSLKRNPCLHVHTVNVDIFTCVVYFAFSVHLAL